MEIRPRAYLTVDGTPLPVLSGDVTLDAGAVPYVRASVEVALSSPEEAEAVDPRDGIRAVLEGRDELDSGDVFPSDTLYPSESLFPGGGEFTGRTFDLSVRVREVTHEGRTMRLELASDEALLQQYRPLTVDSGARAHEGSIRDVCNYVLGKVGASLVEDGGPDPAVTAFWEVTNVLINPSFSGDVEGWQPEIENSEGLVHSTAVGGFHGSTCARVTSEGPGYFGISSVATTRVSPGEVWTASGYLRTPTSDGWTGHVFVRVYDEDGFTIKDYKSDEVTIGANWTSRVAVTVTMPPRAATARVVYRRQTGGAGAYLYVDAVMFYKDPEVIPFFTPNDPTDGYTAAWEDEANTSVVTRTPIVEREPELFDWQPDTSAWDFLLPITASVGLALFCDEGRVWRLIDPDEFSTEQQLSIAGWNTTSGSDRIDVDSPGHVTGVTVRYRWRTRAGIERERLDTAGEPGATELIDIARPFPGRGTAAKILNRRQGAGRTQNVTAITNWDTDPTMGVQITLPGTTEQRGTVKAVTFRLDDGTMQVRSSGLIDIPAGSIAALTGTIAELTGTIADL